MNFFKNRLVATCLLLVAIFGLTPVIAQGQLQGKADKVQESIWENEKSLWFRLSARNNAAGNLVAIAVDYPNAGTEREALRFAQEEMASALAGKDPEDLYNANAALEPAFQALYQKLSSENLSDNDRKDVESYQTTFNGAQRMLEIAAKEYNEEVQKFRMMVYDQPPAHMLTEWFDIDMPEYYSADGDDYDNAPEAPLMESFSQLPDVPDVPDAPELGSVRVDVSDIIDSVFDGVGDVMDGVMDGVGDILDEVLD